MTQQKLKPGINDLKSQFPRIALEADGWDPSKVFKSGRDYCTWKCKKGHKWVATINSRTSKKNGCPYCSNQKCLSGFNDLQTKFPEIAKEADGWNPSNVISGSHRIFWWKCSKNHIWQASIDNRVNRKSNCPYCNGQQVIRGKNDLQTKFPEIAKEAANWDPTNFPPHSNELKSWKCKNHGHIWEAQICNRTAGDNCPYCAGHTLLIGFNDLKTKNSDLAAEADGWEPTRVKFNCTKFKKSWKCKNCGHKWKKEPYYRTKRGSGCRKCVNFGSFSVEDDAWMYLMELKDTPGQQQIGITNHHFKRIETHEKKKWKLLDITKKSYLGKEVLDTETLIKRWLKSKEILVPGTKENWFTSKLKVKTLAEIQQKCGIQKPLN